MNRLYLNNALLVACRSAYTMLETLSENPDDLDLSGLKEAIFEAEDNEAMITEVRDNPENINAAIVMGLIEILSRPGSVSNIFEPDSKVVNIIKSCLKDYFSNEFQRARQSHPESADVLRQVFESLFK